MLNYKPHKINMKKKKKEKEEKAAKLKAEAENPNREADNKVKYVPKGAKLHENDEL
jgi:hypothetical protein